MKTSGLSVSEALASGRPYRRWADISWRQPYSGGTVSLTPEEISAQDWKIKPEPLRLKIYVSPDKKQISLDPNSPFNWDLHYMIDEETS